MSLLDLAVSFVVVFGTWRGYRTGAVKTALGLFSWVIALVVATKMAGVLGHIFAPLAQEMILQTAAAFLAVFLLTLLVLSVLAYLFLKLLKALKLGLFDQLAGGILGAGLGLIKALLVLSLLSPILTRLPLWESSPLARAVWSLSPFASEFAKAAFGGVWQSVYGS